MGLSTYNWGQVAVIYGCYPNKGGLHGKEHGNETETGVGFRMKSLVV